MAPPSPISPPQSAVATPDADTPIELPRSAMRAVVGAMRPHQWVKNVLVVVPLVTSHQILDPSKVRASLVALVAFCFCASAGYVVNDLLDRDADRRHPTKRRRPFAS